MTKLPLRWTWPDDPHSRDDFLVVASRQHKALARIMLEQRAGGCAWGWSVYGFNIAQNGNMRGCEESFDVAKAKTKAAMLGLLEAETPLMPEPPEWQPGSAFLTCTIEKQISQKLWAR